MLVERGVHNIILRIYYTYNSDERVQKRRWIPFSMGTHNNIILLLLYSTIAAQQHRTSRRALKSLPADDCRVVQRSFARDLRLWSATCSTRGADVHILRRACSRNRSQVGYISGRGQYDMGYYDNFY